MTEHNNVAIKAVAKSARFCTSKRFSHKAAHKKFSKHKQLLRMNIDTSRMQGFIFLKKAFGKLR